MQHHPDEHHHAQHNRDDDRQHPIPLRSPLVRRKPPRLTTKIRRTHHLPDIVPGVTPPTLRTCESRINERCAHIVPADKAPNAHPSSLSRSFASTLKSSSVVVSCFAFS